MNKCDFRGAVSKLFPTFNTTPYTNKDVKNMVSTMLEPEFISNYGSFLDNELVSLTKERQVYLVNKLGESKELSPAISDEKFSMFPTTAIATQSFLEGIYRKAKTLKRAEISTSSFIKALKTNANSEELKILEKLESVNPNVKIKFVNKLSDVIDGFDANIAVYDGTANTVYLSGDIKPTQLSEVLYHELVHAISDAVIKLNPRGEEVKQLIKLRNQALSSINDSFLESLSLHEFVAVALQNEEIRQKLNKSYAEGRTLFQKLKDIIRRLLGMPNNTFVDKVLSIDWKSSIVPKKLGKSAYTTAADSVYLEGNSHDKGHIMVELLKNNTKFHAPFKEDGTEHDYYLENNSIKRNRLSGNAGISSKFRKTPPKDPVEVAEIVAERAFADIGDNVELPIGDEGELFTKANFIEYVKSNIRKASLRGTIGHLVVERAIAKLANLNLDEDFNSRLQSALDSFKMLELNPKKHNFTWIEKAVEEYMEAANFNVDPKDKVYGSKVALEVKIESKVMNFVSSADILMQRNSDGKLGIIDTKFGHSVLNNRFKRLLNDYAAEYEYIGDNSQAIAKLEILLRAIAIKENFPEAKFFKLAIGNLQNGSISARKNVVDAVNIDNYMAMVINIFKDKSLTDSVGLTKSSDTKTLYEALLEKSPRIFDTVEYFDHRLEFTENTKPDTEPESILETELGKLRNLIVADKQLKNTKMQNEIATSVERVLRISSVPEENWDSTYKDLNLIEGALGNFQEFELPATRSWARMYFNARYNLNMHRERKVSQLQIISKQLLDEYQKKYGKVGIGWFKHVIYSNSKGTGLYDFAYKKYVVHSVERERLVHKGDPEYHTLTSIQKQYLDLVNSMTEEASEFYNEQRYEVTSASPNSKRKFKKSALELYNAERGHQSALTERKMEKGFFFKFPMETEEYRKYKPNSAVKAVLDARESKAPGIFKKITNSIIEKMTHFEDNYYQGESDLPGHIPLKGLGTSHIDNGFMYTKNLTYATIQGYENFLKKKYMDDVATLGLGLKAYLSELEFKQGKDYKLYKFSIDGQTYRKIIGVTKRLAPMRKMPILRFKDAYGNEHAMVLSLDKIIKAIGRFSISIIMPFRFLQVIGTTTQAWLTWQRDVASNKLYEKLFGKLTQTYKNYSYKSFRKAHKLVGGISLDAGNPDRTLYDNKLYRIANLISFIPNSYLGLVRRNKLQVANMRGTSIDMAYEFQNQSEEVISYLILASQLLEIQHTSKDSSGKTVTKSLYDWYELDENKNLVWKGGRRGAIKNADGTYTYIEGITQRESDNMKAVYEYTQGGYDESFLAPIEAYSLGAAMMSLVRWIPRILFRLANPKRKELLLGAYRQNPNDPETVIDENGNTIPVWEWEHRQTEGLLFTVFNTVLKVAKGGGIDAIRKLDTAEKKNLMEVLIGFTVMAASSLAFSAGFDDDDLDNTEAKWIKRYLIENLSQQINPVNIMDNVINMGEIVVFKRAFDGVLSIFSYATAVVLQNRTETGDIRGQKDFLRSLPYLGPVYSQYRMYENLKLLENEKE